MPYRHYVSADTAGFYYINFSEIQLLATSISYELGIPITGLLLFNIHGSRIQMH